MSTHIIIRQGLATLFKSTLIDVFANPSNTDEAVYLLQENFTFTAKEIAQIFQNSYRCAFIAIGSGVLPLDKQPGWWQSIADFSPTDEFFLYINKLYLQPFAQQQGMTKAVLHRFRQMAIEECQILAQLTLFKTNHQRLTAKELAGFIGETGGMNITDLVLEQIPQQSMPAQSLMAFLRYEELLGNSLLFFLHEQISQEARFQQTLLALQREGLMLNVHEVKQVMQSTEEQFNQAVAARQFGEVAQLALQLENLQQVESRMVSHTAQYAHFFKFNQKFSAWAPVLQMQLTPVLAALKHFGDLRSQGEKFLESLQQVMETTAVSPLLKPHDELLIEHSSANLVLINQVIQDWQQVPQTEPQISKMANQLACLVTSIHDLKLAEELFLLAYQQAKHQDDRALSAINLFYLYIRQRIYDQALFYLQEAIKLNAARYAPYYVQTYTVQQILSADGMGYVLLAQHRSKKKWVIIKCFWETFHDSLEALFQEAFLIAKVAGECVPTPLDCGFVDLIRQERGYLVTEYLETTIDGETWLQQYGKLDLKTGVAVGLQVAKCLQMAHQRGIFHLNLKPAHLLFKRRKTATATKTSVVAVKIMNFGLTKVAQPLTKDIKLDPTRTDWSLLLQSAMADILDYVSPEQQEMDASPDAKSDVYAFGRTWYRLLTGESPQNWQPAHLATAPALFELLSDCVQPIPAERLAVTDLISRLMALLIDKRRWWEQLDANWKKIFQQAIEIETEPNDSELEKLFNLSTLNCFNSEISELKALSALTRLQTLNCNSNKISSLEPLRYLTNLQRLSCQNNQISDLEPLRYLTHLQSLGIEKNQISDLEPLRYLTNLQILSCEKNQIQDLEPLHGLTKLQRLYCHNNQIRELEPLSGLTKLHVLNCGGNQINELKPLFNLKQLQKLECGDNPLRESGLFRQSEVNKLQKALPRCRIII